MRRYPELTSLVLSTSTVSGPTVSPRALSVFPRMRRARKEFRIQQECRARFREPVSLNHNSVNDRRLYANMSYEGLGGFFFSSCCLFSSLSGELQRVCIISLSQNTSNCQLNFKFVFIRDSSCSRVVGSKHVYCLKSKDAILLLGLALCKLSARTRIRRLGSHWENTRREGG